MTRLRALSALALAAAVAVLVTTAGADPSTVLPASVVDIQKASTIQRYVSFDYGTKAAASDDRAADTKWRVVADSGNCCENYVTITKQGRLFDFGGTWVNYTDDRGVTWKSVRPLTPLVNGEGTIVIAPNGDILGIGWDPYSGDHLQAFKYEAFSGKWFYNELPVHQPFYDREWLTVVPGQFSVDGQTVPYVTFLKGGWPTKELWYFSSDGLNYLEASSKFVDATQNGTQNGWLATDADASFDWSQPNSNTGLTPLGNGSALARPDTTGPWATLDRDALTWRGFRFGDGSTPQGRHQVDSGGRIHNVISRDTSFDYRISTDGGRTWKSINVPLPAGHSVEHFDFRANKDAGVGAVAIRAARAGSENDQDLAYKIRITGNTPFLQRAYVVGLGDAGATAGVGNSVRMDFQTIAIFPNGRIALSFLDSTTTGIAPSTGQPRSTPNLAVELGTTFRK